MKLAVFEAEPWVRSAWHRVEGHHEEILIEECLTVANVADYTAVDIISIDMSVLDENLLANFDRLRFIAARSTGVDQIDLKYCKKHGITVSNVPAYAENAVAEHVFALLFAISRHIVEAVGRTRKKNFSWEGIQASELRGKTMAVIGTGAIGRRVSEIAQGFGMKVVAYDVMPDENWADTNAIRYLSLEQALQSADIISLHVPANPQTHHLLSDDQFELMKDGTVLINTARGDVVDTPALLKALSRGKIAAAGLDVLPEEHTIRKESEQLETLLQQKGNSQMLLANHMLLQHPKVMVTPHCAFFSREAVHRLLEVTIANIEAFIRGQPRNVVLVG